jgi:hypothetical protein
MMKISRSKVQFFLDCPRCFYLDMVKKIRRPPGYPFSLNNAVDGYLKREFDQYREQGLPHPIQMEQSPGLIPAKNEQLDLWRNSFKGVTYDHEGHDCTYYGGIDDLWVNENGEHVIVDYKATAGPTPIQSLPVWADGYVRQLSFYAYLLEKNGLMMSKTGILLYATASTVLANYQNRLEFEHHLIQVDLDTSWIEPTLDQLQENLKLKEAPPFQANCAFCNFVEKGSKE